MNGCHYANLNDIVNNRIFKRRFVSFVARDGSVFYSDALYFCMYYHDELIYEFYFRLLKYSAAINHFIRNLVLSCSKTENSNIKLFLPNAYFYGKFEHMKIFTDKIIGILYCKYSILFFYMLHLSCCISEHKSNIKTTYSMLLLKCKTSYNLIKMNERGLYSVFVSSQEHARWLNSKVCFFFFLMNEFRNYLR